MDRTDVKPSRLALSHPRCAASALIFGLRSTADLGAILNWVDRTGKPGFKLDRLGQNAGPVPDIHAFVAC
ncbi:hypothetical protein AAFG07_15885 [Bradyrhizobium sp. B097]|uniref:hypothetical protein n=1 Tax=Bradyrhizobium sp. B097 TaxID=3140244 RepID=UPI0031833BC7